MASKLILITGGSSGIGLCCARELAEQDYKVVVASRTPPPIDHRNITHVSLDLTSRESVERFADSWTHGPLQSIVLNAGSIAGGAPTFDANGIETTFAVNYLNQAYLFFLLRARDAFHSKCRVVFLTTALHDPKNPVKMPPNWLAPDEVAHATDPTFAKPMVRYSTAKLAVIFFVYALHRRTRGGSEGIDVVAYEPGFVPGGGSQLAREASSLVQWLSWALEPVTSFIVRRMGVPVSTPQASGSLMAELATKRGRFETMDVNGKYILLDRVKQSSVESYDEVKQDDLWNWTVQQLGIREP